MDRRIFISYSTQDRDIAFKIVQYLESNGHPCWIAPRNITSGMDYTDVINEAIEQCVALVLVFSEHSVKSQFVKKELTTAISYNKTILPFKISQVELKGGFLFMLNNVQWIEATSRPESKFPQIIHGLQPRDLPDAVPPNTLSGNTKKRWPIIATIAALAAIAALALLFLLPSSSPTDETLTPDNTPPSVAPQPTADTLTTNNSDPAPQTNTVTETAHTNSAKKNATKPSAPSTNTTPTVVEKEEPKPATVEQPSAEAPIVETPKTNTANNHAVKMGKARRYLNNRKYKAALDLFEELKRENPSDKALDALIDECRSHL